VILPSHPSTPIIMAHENFDTRDFILTSFVIGSPKVKVHKAVLGRQAYCYNGKHRMWVWEKYRELGEKPNGVTPKRLIWRAWVSNAGGISFEVAKNATPEEAQAAWEDYKLAMGVTKEKIDAKRAEMESP
jgi:hypothetical protein